MAKIERILVANRGEIALRAIRTIKEMGKKAIAVYSRADKEAHYLKFADAAVCIGGEKSSESYLNIPAIITAAELTGADAIFPGYGFLSENEHFVEACEKHNIKFIGPSAKIMTEMADKSKAKDIMSKNGIPVIPGSDGILPDVESAKAEATKIGYPVILKATAGGGGRGGRRHVGSRIGPGRRRRHGRGLGGGQPRHPHADDQVAALDQGSQRLRSQRSGQHRRPLRRRAAYLRPNPLLPHQARHRLHRARR